MITTANKDLLETLIVSDLGSPRRQGRRPFWLCPFHDDRNPSLSITPDQEHWKCFGCGRSGDAIAWLMEKRGLTFKDAAAQLGRELTPQAPAIKKPPASFHRKPDREIDADWSNRAELLARECAKGLSEDSAKRARVWLINRGLKPATLSRWQIGSNPGKSTRHDIWVERGVTIPWTLGGRVTAINVRRPTGEPKYKMVAGSSRRGLYLGEEIVPGRPTLLTEGEFDALLAWQLVRDLVNVATLGSAGDRPDRTAILQLITSPLILVAYDADPAGSEGAEFWRGATARVHRIPIPCGNDITEFHQHGGDFGTWIRGQLKLAGQGLV